MSLTTLDNILTRYRKEAGDLRITKLDCIKDLNDLLAEMPITKPAEQFEKIYYVDGFYDYKLPSDFKETIAIYSNEVSVIRYVSLFRFKLETPAVAFTDQSDGGKRYLKVRNPRTSATSVLMTGCDSLTADGAWVASGSASDLALDVYTKEQGSGSIKFTISGTGGVITFTRSSAIDAVSFTEKMRGRLKLWLPESPSSVAIRFGNDSTKYFEHSVTEQANGLSFDTDGVNELEFAEESSTETGTVDKSNMIWFQLRFTFDPTVTNSDFRVDKIVLAKPEVLEHEYYTNYLAMDSDGVLIEKITESEESTDEPIIKDYPDYVNTIIDGMCASHLKNKAPERSIRFANDYVAKTAGGELIGGIKYLLDRYPLRRASYKRVKTLPPLHGNRGKSRFV